MSSLFGVHSATFLNQKTKIPLFKTDIITALTVTDSGDLVPREGGSFDYPVDHFQARKSLEIQLTAKQWDDGIYNVAAGASISKIATLASQSNVVEVEKKNFSGTFTFVGANSASLGFGTFLLVRNSTNWDLYLYDDEDSPLSPDSSLQVSSGLALNTSTALHIGNGASVQLAAGYTPAEGDFVILTVVPQDADAAGAFSASVSQGDRRPYVSAIFAAESQGSLFSIYVPRMKCSSGIPFTLNEKTDNEFQLTFMASLENKNSKIWELKQLDPRTV